MWREQAGQQRPVDAVGVGARLADLQAERLGELPELPVDVLPLPHPQVVEVLGLAQPPERARAELPLLRLEVVPEVEQAEEVARRVGEAGVLLVGLGAALSGRSRGSWMVSPATIAITSRLVPWVFDSITIRPKRGSMGSFASCWPTRVSFAPPAPVVPVGDRAELGEQVEAVLDAAGVRRGEERERGDVAEAERDHLQDDRGQVGAQDLRLRVLGAAGEVLLRVQPDRDAVAGAARCGRSAGSRMPARSPRSAAAAPSSARCTG